MLQRIQNEHWARLSREDMDDQILWKKKIWARAKKIGQKPETDSEISEPEETEETEYYTDSEISSFSDPQTSEEES